MPTSRTCSSHTLPTSSGVMEDGIELRVHHPLVVRMSIKAHQPVHGPAHSTCAAVQVSPGPTPSCIVHAEGEAFVIFRSGGFMLERGCEVSIDAEGWAQWGVECRAVRHQDAIEEGFQGTVGLTFDLRVEDVGGFHGAIGGAGQAGGQAGALVGEVSGIGGCHSNGSSMVSGKVRSLLRQEGPRVELKTTGHQVSGGLGQT